MTIVPTISDCFPILYIIIIDGDKSYAKQWKHLLQILTCFHEITTQSGEVLYHNAVDFPLLQCF